MERKELILQMVDGFQSIQRAVLRSKGIQKGEIPFGQKAVLFIIAGRESTNVKYISDTLQITSGAATQQVEALVKEGFVSRETDVNDRRNVIIKLTKSGDKKISELRAKRLEKAEAIFSEISKDELKDFIKIIEKVKTKLEEDR